MKLSRNDKTAAKELELLKRIKEHLEENKMAKSFTTDDEEEQEWLTSYNLLTYKPVIFAANVTEMIWQMTVQTMQGSESSRVCCRRKL